MKTVQLIFVSLLLTGTLFTCQAQTTSKTDQDETLVISGRIKVYYFHNTRRCETCKAVEAVTRNTLEENYPEQMKEGEITFQSLNIEEDINEPLARKLHVSGQTLLIVKDGNKKDLTNDAFMYARSNPEKLKEKIISTIEKL